MMQPPRLRCQQLRGGDDGYANKATHLWSRNDGGKCGQSSGLSASFHHCKSFVGVSFSLPLSCNHQRESSVSTSSSLPLSCKHRRESSVNIFSSLPLSLPLFHNHQYVALFAHPSSPRCSCWRWSIDGFVIDQPS